MRTDKMAMSTFDNYVYSLERKRRNFILSATAYTRMIKEENLTTMFAKEFKLTNYSLLPLINKVRNDARKYIETHDIENEDHIDFSSLLDNIIKEKTICKIDINGAYWNYALKRGVISKKTDDFCYKIHEDQSYKLLKSSRLKSLGSLATRKIIYTFEEGKEIEDKRITKIENTRDLYIDICRGIDYLMKDCARNVKGCVYYYWDCIFVDKEFSQDAIDFFKKQEYDITVEETTLDYVLIGDHGYLISKKDGKMYLIKKEDKHLLID